MLYVLMLNHKIKSQIELISVKFIPKTKKYWKY